MPGVFPDYPAPVIRTTDEGEGSELVMMRWGMPPPPRTGGPPVTNIRNTCSPHWRDWLKPEHRCLVPFNSFAEYAPKPNPETKKEDVVWFALADDRPLAAFAGIWTVFRGRSWGEIEADSRPTRRLRLPDDFSECRGRADPSEGNGGDRDDRRGGGRVAAPPWDEMKSLQWPLADDVLQLVMPGPEKKIRGHSSALSLPKV